MPTRPSRKRSVSLAILWMKRGDALDLCCLIERTPSDPRQGDVAALRNAAQQLENHLTHQDMDAAVAAAYEVDRLLKNANHRELGPIVKTGRKIRESFAGAPAQANQERHTERAVEWARWQTLADDYWSRNPNASKNEAASYVLRKLGLETGQHKTVSRRIRKKTG